MDKSWNQNESLSLHSFPKTSGLIVKSHCYFKVLAMCIWRSHTWSPTSSSRHPSILKSSYSMSGLVENRCWYKKDMLVLLSTLLTSFLLFCFFKSERDHLLRLWPLASFLSSPLLAQLRQKKLPKSALLVPIETCHVASTVSLHYKNKLHLWYQNRWQSLFLLASGSLAPLGLMLG